RRRQSDAVERWAGVLPGRGADAWLSVERGPPAHVRHRATRHARFGEGRVAGSGRTSELADAGRGEPTLDHTGIRIPNPEPRAPQVRPDASHERDGAGPAPVHAPRERVRRFRPRAAHPEAAFDGRADAG